MVRRSFEVGLGHSSSERRTLLRISGSPSSSFETTVWRTNKSLLGRNRVGVSTFLASAHLAQGQSCPRKHLQDGSMTNLCPTHKRPFVRGICGPCRKANALKPAQAPSVAVTVIEPEVQRETELKTPIRKKRGRPPKHGTAMTPAEQT